LLSHATVFWETFDPVLVWPKLTTRPVTTMAMAIAVHGGIALCLGMPTFGLAMIIANLAFVPPGLIETAMSLLGHAGILPDEQSFCPRTGFDRRIASQVRSDRGASRGEVVLRTSMNRRAIHRRTGEFLSIARLRGRLLRHVRTDDRGVRRSHLGFFPKIPLPIACFGLSVADIDRDYPEGVNTRTKDCLLRAWTAEARCAVTIANRSALRR
jgi:hypothetical protein